MNLRFTPALLLVLALLSFTAPRAFSKAYYAGENEMIFRSEVIAVVDISKVESAKLKREHWTYSEVADATVEQPLKGTLEKQVQLYGGEDFICAQVHFQPGRFLVFLKRDGELLVGSNWHLSIRPIKNGKVEWYTPGESMSLSWQPLPEVLQRIGKSSKFAK